MNKRFRKIMCGLVIAVALTTCTTQMGGNTFNVDPPIVHKF